MIYYKIAFSFWQFYYKIAFFKRGLYLQIELFHKIRIIEEENTQDGGKFFDSGTGSGCHKWQDSAWRAKGNSLGENFPVFDRKDGNKPISTKSLDIAAQSYQNPKTLERMLNKYVDSMKNFETKYFKSSDTFKWTNGTTISKSDYNSKVLEIVFPDVIMTEDALEVLTTFKATMASEGIEVWYRIAY